MWQPVRLHSATWRLMMLVFALVMSGMAHLRSNVCYNWSATESVAQITGLGCEGWAGNSRHWGISGGGEWQQIGDDEYSELWADWCPPHNPGGGPGEEPPQSGDDPMCVPGNDGTCNTNTPIIVPLTNAQAFKLTNKSGGVQFDMNGDGTPEQTAWTAADSQASRRPWEPLRLSWVCLLPYDIGEESPQVSGRGSSADGLHLRRDLHEQVMAREPVEWSVAGGWNLTT